MRVFLVAVLLLGCGNKKKDGFAPAESWSAGQGEAQPQPTPKIAGGGHGSTMPPGHPPASDLPPGHPPMTDMPPGHPPATGMPPGHPPAGPDVTQMGLSPPDPNRKVDPNRRIKGTLKVAAKAAANVKAGGAMFLIVKKADANGLPSGPPLAVDKVLYATNLKFELTEAHAMVANTELVGDVVVTARYDQDSDAISKQPGDVIGQTRVKIPADNVTLTLDTIIQ